MLTVLGLLLSVVIIAATSGSGVTGVPLPTAGGDGASGRNTAEPLPPPTPSPSPSPAAESGVPPLATAILAAILVAGAVILLLALWWLIARLRGVRLGRGRGRPRPVVESVTEALPTAEEEREQVVDALTAGLEELDEETSDPRRAVIACWLRLEAAATAVGTPRRPEDTSSDLVSRLLRGHQVDETSLHRLGELYRGARYAPSTVDTSMREEAKAILGRLRAELRGREELDEPAGVRPGADAE
ncbi:MAG TPA: DUF4129 domain-containing protein [Actinopolymorphaceae bacterium]